MSPRLRLRCCHLRYNTHFNLSCRGGVGDKVFCENVHVCPHIRMHAMASLLLFVSQSDMPNSARVAGVQEKGGGVCELNVHFK